MKMLEKIPYFLLILVSLTLGLAPFTPRPHLVEKLAMLLAGDLVKPIDILDLVIHASPVTILIAKIGHGLVSNQKPK